MTSAKNGTWESMQVLRYDVVGEVLQGAAVQFESTSNQVVVAVAAVSAVIVVVWAKRGQGQGDATAFEASVEV